MPKRPKNSRSRKSSGSRLLVLARTGWTWRPSRLPSPRGRTKVPITIVSWADHPVRIKVCVAVPLCEEEKGTNNKMLGNVTLAQEAGRLFCFLPLPHSAGVASVTGPVGIVGSVRTRGRASGPHTTKPFCLLLHISAMDLARNNACRGVSRCLRGCLKILARTHGR